MSFPERLFEGLRLAALLLVIAGLVLAEFARAWHLGLALVLVGLGAGAAALAVYVIVRQERINNPTHQERTL